MRYKNTFISLALLLTALSSCTRTMSYEEMEAYARNPENGMLQKKTLNGVEYTLMYRPSDLLAYRHLNARDSISDKDRKEMRAHYGRQHCFLFSVAYGGKEVLKSVNNFQQYSRLVHKMAFDMGRYIYITTDKNDTLSVMDSHFARTFGHGSSNDILLVFNREEKSAKHYTFFLNDFGLHTGNTRFKWKGKDINRRLKIKQSD